LVATSFALVAWYTLNRAPAPELVGDAAEPA
jgi:hypothetical protein